MSKVKVLLDTMHLSFSDLMTVLNEHDPEYWDDAMLRKLSVIFDREEDDYYDKHNVSYWLSFFARDTVSLDENQY